MLELQELPCFATRYAALSVRSVNTSPSRGKIRPGKELIILPDDREFRANNEGDEPPLSEESDLGPPSQSAAGDPTGTVATGSSTGAATKKFSSLSMAERQAEWLRKKQEKMEVERSRQEEEKEKELTFQPKILRRVTLGDKPTKDPPSMTATAQPPRVLQRSDTGGGGSSNSRKLDISGASEPPSKPSAGPKEKAIPRVPPRSAGRRKKPQSSVPVSQPIEISSDLLDSMKSELMASISKRTSVSPTKAAAMIENDKESSAIEGAETATESPEASAPAEDQLLLPLKSWSDQPMIGGRRIDFDSSETKARLVLQDAAKFELSTMYRKTDKKAKRDGVALHMGRREDNFEEEVIAVLFDKEKVSELEAARWWCEHEHRFAQFMRELPKPMDFGFA